MKDDGGDALIEIVRKCLPYYTYMCARTAAAVPLPRTLPSANTHSCARTRTRTPTSGSSCAAMDVFRRQRHRRVASSINMVSPHTLAPFLRHGTFPSLPLQYHGIRVVNIVYLNVYICVCVCVCVCVCDRVCVRAFACPIAHTILCSSNRTPYMSTSISSRPYTYTYMHSIHTQKQTQTHIQKSRSRR